MRTKGIAIAPPRGQGFDGSGEVDGGDIGALLMLFTDCV
jgi:hypothetical protein